MKRNRHTTHLSFLAGIIAVCCLSLCSTYGFSGSGSGTEESPYIITTASQLDEIRNELTAHYRLGNDINLGTAPWNSGAGWEPL